MAATSTQAVELACACGAVYPAEQSATFRDLPAPIDFTVNNQGSIVLLAV